MISIAIPYTLQDAIEDADLDKKDKNYLNTSDVINRITSEMDRQKKDGDEPKLVAHFSMNPNDANLFLDYLLVEHDFQNEIFEEHTTDEERNYAGHLIAMLEMITHQISNDPFNERGHGAKI